MSNEAGDRRGSPLAAEVREIVTRREEILEARRNPEAGKRKWADFGEVYDTWNRKAKDLVGKLCGPSLAAKWNFGQIRAMFWLDQDVDICLKEQERKQAMLTENVAQAPSPVRDIPPRAAVPQKTPAYRAGRPELPDRVFHVWRDFQFALNKSGKRAPTDRDLYEWLKVNGRETSSAARYDFGTWTRYLRKARNLLGRQKV